MNEAREKLIEVFGNAACWAERDPETRDFIDQILDALLANRDLLLEAIGMEQAGWYGFRTTQKTGRGATSYRVYDDDVPVWRFPVVSVEEN